MTDLSQTGKGANGGSLFGPSQFDLGSLMGASGADPSMDLNAMTGATGEMGSGGSNTLGATATGATPATTATSTTATPTEGDFSGLAPASPGGPSTQKQFAYNLGLSTGPNPSSAGELAKTNAASGTSTTGVAK